MEASGTRSQGTDGLFSVLMPLISILQKNSLPPSRVCGYLVSERSIWLFRFILLNFNMPARNGLRIYSLVIPSGDLLGSFPINPPLVQN